MQARGMGQYGNEVHNSAMCIAVSNSNSRASSRFYELHLNKLRESRNGIYFYAINVSTVHCGSFLTM